MIILWLCLVWCLSVNGLQLAPVSAERGIVPPKTTIYNLKCTYLEWEMEPQQKKLKQHTRAALNSAGNRMYWQAHRADFMRESHSSDLLPSE
jgi:hypothetical protein